MLLIERGCCVTGKKKQRERNGIMDNMHQPRLYYLMSLRPTMMYSAVKLILLILKVSNNRNNGKIECRWDGGATYFFF